MAVAELTISKPLWRRLEIVTGSVESVTYDCFVDFEAEHIILTRLDDGKLTDDTEIWNLSNEDKLNARLRPYTYMLKADKYKDS